MDLVTCAITTHKRKPEIVERALKSILNQTYKNIEVFVVDDSPSDWEYRSEVKNMVESYSEHNVMYIAHEECMGACVARNTALENAKGVYIGYLDDDDEWCSDKIEKQLQGFTNDNIALVYCDHKIIYDGTDRVKNIVSEKHSGYVFDKLFFSNFIGSTSFPLIKTKCLKEIGGFDPLMPAAQDYDVWIRIAEKYEVNYVSAELVVYHAHEGEQITKNPAKKNNGLKRIMEKHKDYLNANEEAYWVRYMKLILSHMNAKQYSEALRCWRKAAFKCPLKITENLHYLYLIFAKMFVSIRDRRK